MRPDQLGWAILAARPSRTIASRRSTGPFIAQLLQEGQFPYLERLIVEAEDFPDPDVVFERRLAMVLDGLAARIAQPS